MAFNTPWFRNVIVWEVRIVDCIPPWLADSVVFRAAVKAITAAQLSMASLGVYRVTLDEAIEAMRLTAADMSVKYKETSLSVRLPSVYFNSSIHICIQGLAVSIRVTPAIQVFGC